MRADELDLWRRADALLAELIDLPEETRRRELDHRGVDPELHSRVERLLASAATGRRLLDRELDLGGLHDPGAEAPSSPSLAGRRFGAYVLDEEIGRGGMAVVYGAHRADGAFEQRVAVKILGSGLLPTSAAARFRREQELLARLRHPHVANLLDGGVAADGTPFLVMERIDGRPLDRFADEERLDAARRVALLLQVAGAVAYAHRHLVVHRDLKPSNVLVTATGEAKLLDFGIAKLLEAGEAAERTEARSRFLTPGFAAPEQVDGGPVTTATDVFGLGRILERLSRGVEVDRDLANIRAKALHFEPERRYADARAFAEDLARWRDGQPVIATPDSRLYRARKWARRHRAGFTASALVALVAAAGGIATLVQAERARREARTAEAVSAFLVDLFQASDPAESLGREITVGELLDRGVQETRRVEGEPGFRARLLDALGGVYQSLGRHERALELWRESLELRSGDPSKAARRQGAALRDRIGVALFELDRLDESGVELERALAERTALDGPSSAGVGETLNHLGVLAGHREELTKAEAWFRKALAVRRPLATTDEGRVGLASTLHSLGNALNSLGRFEESEAALREALELHRAALGASHPEVAHDLNALANLLSRSGRAAEAEAPMREGVALRRRLYGESHPLVAKNLNDLAVHLEHRGELAGAADLYRQALASYEALHGADHQATVIVRSNFARLLLSTGEFAEAEALFRRSIASLARSDADGGRNETIALTGRGDALHGLGRLPESRAELERALVVARDSIRDAAFVAMVSLELGRLDLTEGRIDSARDRLTTAESGYRERYGAEHIRTARAAMWLGVAKLRGGRSEEGAALLRAALATQEALLPPRHPHLEATRREVERLEASSGN